MPETKTFIYRYNDFSDVEELTDPLGEVEVPRMGDLMYLKDRTWKVTGVFLEHGIVPRYHVRLTDVSEAHLVNWLVLL
jgi:hypothetical protein